MSVKHVIRRLGTGINNQHAEELDYLGIHWVRNRGWHAARQPGNRVLHFSSESMRWELHEVVNTERLSVGKPGNFPVHYQIDVDGQYYLYQEFLVPESEL